MLTIGLRSWNFLKTNKEPSLNQSPVRLLLIDDDEDDLVNIQGILGEIQNSKYVLDWKSSYEQGLAALLTGAYDACLLDYRLGQWTGLDLLSEAQKRGSKCPIILLTGHGDFDLDVKAMQSGASDYLVKGQITAPLLERSIRYSVKHALDVDNLSTQKESFQTLFNSTFEGIIVQGQGKVIEANAAAGEIFKYSASEMTDLPLVKFIRADFHGDLNRQLESGRDLAMEAIGIQKNGAEIYVALSSRTVSLKGHWVSLVAVRDLTQRKQMEMQILQQDRLASLGLLASSLAHEIGTPLGVIRGRAELLQKSADEKTKTTMHLIVTQIDRIAKLVNSLLHIARGTQSSTASDVNLRPVIEDVLNLMSHELERKNIVLHLQMKEDFTVRSEPGPLGQVILNLLVNAIHAIESAKAPQMHKISITALREKNEGRISVQDTGCGISEANLNRLFQPFFTTKDVGVGTGLGLVTSYNLVNSWGGSIQVESKENVGSTFNVILRS